MCYASQCINSWHPSINTKCGSIEHNQRLSRLKKNVHRSGCHVGKQDNGIFGQCNANELTDEFPCLGYVPKSLFVRQSSVLLLLIIFGITVGALKCDFFRNRSKKFSPGPFQQTPRGAKLNMGPRARAPRGLKFDSVWARARGPKLNLRLERGPFKRSCSKISWNHTSNVPAPTREELCKWNKDIEQRGCFESCGSFFTGHKCHFSFKDCRHRDVITLLKSQRFGEASNRGPMFDEHVKGLLAIGSINPTSITSKLDILHDLGPGVWSMSETSATYRQQQISRAFFKKKSWHCVFGQPVRAHRNGIMALRGVAQGVGVVSSFPSWKALAPLSDELEFSCRILASFTQVSPNLTLQLITLYGPHSKAMVSPLAFLDKLMRTALERARLYSGPAIILGDLNYDLEDIPSWELLEQCGYADAAVLDAQKRNTFPNPTCKGLTRRTFILIPQIMQPALQHCDILDDYLFDTHPVLRALFKVDILTQPIEKINLPKSLDDFLFDEEKLEDVSDRVCSSNQDDFQRLLQDQRMEGVAKPWTDVAEQSLVSAVVDVEGREVNVNKCFKGRSHPELVHRTPPSIPIPKPGRDGDFNPSGEFHSVSLRRFVDCRPWRLIASH